MDESEKFDMSQGKVPRVWNDITEIVNHFYWVLIVSNILNSWNDDRTVAESTNLFQTMDTTELTSIQITSNSLTITISAIFSKTSRYQRIQNLTRLLKKRVEWDDQVPSIVDIATESLITFTRSKYDNLKNKCSDPINV